MTIKTINVEDVAVSSGPDPTRDCAHGHLRAKCPYCEIVELERENSELRDKESAMLCDNAALRNENERLLRSNNEMRKANLELRNERERNWGE